jgi:lipoprotein-anchoring transpeptidase ErfK/SrfK
MRPPATARMRASRAGWLSARAPRLRGPVAVVAGDRRLTLPSRRARVGLDADAAVREALAVTRDRGAVGRAFGGLPGLRRDEDLPAPITVDDAALARFARRAARALSHPARDARIRAVAGGRIVPVPAQPGRAVRPEALAARVRRALADPRPAARTVTAPARTQPPRVTVAELAKRYPTYLVVDRPSFQLRLYKHLKLVKTYRVAVGQIGLETPAGTYRINTKAVNPDWNVPMSPWAGSLAGQVIPGGSPANPLKARWLGIHDGVGIHGTGDLSSLGSAASHGCIRMAPSDVIDLYPRVPVGTPITIR